MKWQMPGLKGLWGSKWDMHGAPLHPQDLPLPEAKVIIPDPLQVNRWGNGQFFSQGTRHNPLPRAQPFPSLHTLQEFGSASHPAAAWVPMLKRHSFGKRILCKLICK